MRHAGRGDHEGRERPELAGAPEPARWKLFSKLVKASLVNLKLRKVKTSNHANRRTPGRRPWARPRLPSIGIIARRAVEILLGTLCVLQNGSHRVREGGSGDTRKGKTQNVNE